MKIKFNSKSLKIPNEWKQITNLLSLPSEKNQPYITKENVWKFPIYGKIKFKHYFFLQGSLILYGIYLIFYSSVANQKIFSQIILIYFACLGQQCLMKFLDQLLTPYFESWKDQKLITKQLYLNFIVKNIPVTIDVNKFNFLSFIIALFPTIIYLTSLHWFLNNLFGVIFAIYYINYLSVSNFKTVFKLMLGFVFYDIFWVFGSNVMITVATNFKAPIKLQFPFGTKYSLIGLGDIIIPGVIILLALKFDLENSLKELSFERNTENDDNNNNLINQDIKTKLENFLDNKIKTPYFKAGLIGYAIGIVLTFIAMEIFQSGQPALLYLAPLCCGSLFIQALIRKEFQELWSFEVKDLQQEENIPSEKALKSQ